MQTSDHMGVITAKRDLFDYSRGEPPSHVLTVLRALTVRVVFPFPSPMLTFPIFHSRSPILLFSAFLSINLESNLGFFLQLVVKLNPFSRV